VIKADKFQELVHTNYCVLKVKLVCGKPVV